MSAADKAKLDGSRPVRARGLKPVNPRSAYQLNLVAPRAGAWIETDKTAVSLAPNLVAPRAGAWIETVYRFRDVHIVESRPVRARGLKHRACPYQ